MCTVMEAAGRPLVDEVDRVWDAAERLRSAVIDLDGADFGDDVVALVAVIGLELALTNAELAAASARTSDAIVAALEDAASAAHEWLVDPAVAVRLDSIGSREHATSVRLRIAGAALEAERGASAAASAPADRFACTRATATRLVRRVRQACFDAALSVIFV